MAQFGRQFYSVAVLGGLVAAGCGRSGPELVEVTGVVTLDGRPVPGAGITFRPRTPGVSAAYGGTDLQGVYTLQYNRNKSGAMPGEFVVDIDTVPLSPADIAALRAAGQPEPAYVALPKKYSRGDALTATVVGGQKNTIDFVLTTK